MTELVRTVRSGSVGLDLILGGGPRLLRRFPGGSRESATLLVRGGPGTGKSVLAADVAWRMARAVGGDVLYVCVEILPSEVLAQRMGFDGFDPATAIDLAQPEACKASGDGPTLVVGMAEMDTDEDGVPDLGSMIRELAQISKERGCNPRVVVVDSLSDGYGLGTRVPRPIVDGVCKMAVQQGWVLVLVEETADERPSQWSFAVDTVLSLEVTAAGRRELRITKHRFGPCQPGPHRLLVEREGVRVLPCFAAYRNAARDLELPPPATRRSLRVPVVGQAPDWSSFDVPDEAGRVVSVQPGGLDALANAIGSKARDGSAQPEAPATQWRGFRVGSLDPMIDGEEWLEAALSQLAASKLPVARIAIGPIEGIWIYEQSETLCKAISMLASILVRRGVIVVLFGVDVAMVMRTVVVDEQWMLTHALLPAARSVKLRRSAGNTTVDFEALLT